MKKILIAVIFFSVCVGSLSAKEKKILVLRSEGQKCWFVKNKISRDSTGKISIRASYWLWKEKDVVESGKAEIVVESGEIIIKFRPYWKNHKWVPTRERKKYAHELLLRKLENEWRDEKGERWF